MGDVGSPEIGGKIIPFPTPPRERNIIKRALLAALAVLGIGTATKVAHDMTKSNPAPISSSATGSEPALSLNPATINVEPTKIPDAQRVNAMDAERIWQDFEKNPKEFMEKNSDLIVIDRQAGPSGLNFRTSPGADNNKYSGNFAFSIKPHTPIKGVGIKIGSDPDGEWVVTQVEGDRTVYYSLNNTEPIPSQANAKPA